MAHLQLDLFRKTAKKTMLFYTQAAKYRAHVS